jgi:hypothetical protein
MENFLELSGDFEHHYYEEFVRGLMHHDFVHSLKHAMIK